MAHAYTPGLRVAEDTVVRRERRLPLKGQVTVQRGDSVEAHTVVARTELPGNVQTVNLAAKRGNKGTEVRMEQVEPRDLVASVTASGQVQPRTKVDIAALNSKNVRSA